MCLVFYLPVCGCNGITYSNGCFAGIAGMSIAYDGECGVCRSSYQSAFDGSMICWGQYLATETFYANLNKRAVLGGGTTLHGIVVSDGLLELNGVFVR